MIGVSEWSMLKHVEAFEGKTLEIIELLHQSGEDLDVDRVTNLLTERGTVLARMSKPDQELSADERERVQQAQVADSRMRDMLREHLLEAQSKNAKMQTARRAQESYNSPMMAGSAFFDRKN
ncbi:hypothetical protein [Tumebacillus flagellatus]|uniref:Flagellar protein FliT n=1 Tax=Tumebacillus flagellatus TaxID=1157490 RepID=A0A074LTW4_9BACL|nr:hypothetical protein [Tumebacillus flagellatus]KEO84075.1 hypothetical protein EL26_06320 [Tumebacillus flagellatus]